MLKLIGSLVIVAAGGIAGMMVARSYSMRPVELKSLLSALQMLETEIKYTATPMAEALNKIAAASDRHAAGFFKKTAGELQLMDGSTVGDAWSKSLDWYYRTHSITAKDVSILKSLGASLGVSDCDNQVKHIKLACELLKREITRAEAEAGKNSRMWNFLGFSGALALVILLY